MSRYRPTPGVVWASTAAAVAPLALLALLVSTVLGARLEPVATTTAAVGVAVWGARAGVLASGRRGRLWRRGLIRLGGLAGIAAIATAIAVASRGTTAPASVVPVAVPAVLLLIVLLAARTIGDIHRRQADPLLTAGAHRAADAALGAVLVTGALTVIAITTAAWSVDALVPPVRWFPLAWLLVTVAALVAARPAMLHARTATPDTSSSERAWLTGLLPIAGATALVVALMVLLLGGGVEQRLRAALPALPALQLDLLGDVADPAAGSSNRRPSPREDVRWQLAALGGIGLLLLLYALAPVARGRRRRLRPVGAGMSLLMFLRSLLGSGRSGRVVADEDTALDETPSPADTVVLDRPPAWVDRLRPRPREPTAAILYDYRLVQRRLGEPRRRRPAETVLAHAAREDTDALRELADLVCAVRYGGRHPTATDADRSRRLTRVLQRDR